jgi:hypothetical protein
MQLGKTRQAMYIQCNNEACLYNHCCNGKAVSITHSECVSIALEVQHAPTVTCGLSVSTVFLHIITKNETFWEKSYKS